MKLRVLNKGRKLLVESTVFEEYTDKAWFSTLMKKPTKITKNDLHNLFFERQTFLEKDFNQIINQAASEWRRVKDDFDDMGPDKSDWRKCSLCGQSTRYIFYITNISSGRKINVGSECIKDFWPAEKSGMQRMIKEAQKFGAIKELRESLPKLGETLQEGLKPTEKALILPASLEKPYLDIYGQVRKVFDEYTEGKRKCGETIQELKVLLSQREQLVENIDNYVQLHANDRYAAKRKWIEWLKRENHYDYQTVLNWLQEDESVTWRSSCRIADPDFMRVIVDDLKPHFEKIGCSIESISRDEYEGYIIKSNSNKRIKFYHKHGELLTKYGWLVFEDKDYGAEKSSLLVSGEGRLIWRRFI